jgi:hypothetical protein
LRLEQRIQYFLACTHYLCGLRDLIYLVSPIVFLVTGVPAVRDATLELFLWHFVPYFLAAQAAFWFIARKETGLRGIIIGFGSFPTLIWALLIVLWGKRSGFMVTAKQRRTTRAWSHLAIYLVAVSCCLAGIAVAFMNRYTRQESAAISILWVIYDIVMLASFLWLGINDLRYQEAPVRKSQPILAFIHANCAPSRMTLRPAMARVVCSVLVSCLCLVVITTSSPLAMQPIQFRPSQQHVQSPHLGLSLRYESLRTTPLVFEQELCLPLAIVGRTQDITDAFDFPWAVQLEANHQRPWITLQFGKFDANGEPPLDASLPAIVNGIQDANIQRWAQAIHSYGQPLYLTVLLHVDRNWSVSSAVANGGIPQDTARAWEHVQSIFNAAGDTNVAWVWAPADPAHDQPYAPPDATINVVLQSMIRYPGSPWPDPTSVLRAVTAHHPGEPLFVEVSGVGSPKEKAAWLQRVVASVRAFPNVHALLYHEGSPDLNATPADDLAWSFTSDPLSFHAMQQWRLLAPSVQPACGAGSGAGPGAGPGAGAGVAP